MCERAHTVIILEIARCDALLIRLEGHDTVVISGSLGERGWWLGLQPHDCAPAPRYLIAAQCLKIVPE
jgi:hypothetical protein